jgi:FMN-dependent NADH-azoreductase
MNILHLDASGRHKSSQSRHLSQEMVDSLQQSHEGTVVYRDISQGLPFVDDTLITSMYMPAQKRSPAQQEVLNLSNTLVEEFLKADLIVLGIPIYNFTMPAAFKAYADLIARKGLTFEYTDAGPKGLVKDKDIYVLITTGGTEVGSEDDFLSPWLRHFFTFLGIEQPIEIIAADGLMMATHPEEKIKAAEEEIHTIAS